MLTIVPRWPDLVYVISGDRAKFRDAFRTRPNHCYAFTSCREAMAPVCCTRNTADSRYWTGSDPNAPNAHSSTFYVIGYASVSSSSRQIQLFLTYRSHSAEPSWRTLYTSSCTMARSKPAGSCIQRCFNRYSLPNYASMTQRAEVDCSTASEKISRGWTLAWPITVSTDAIKADNSHA